MPETTPNQPVTERPGAKSPSAVRESIRNAAAQLGRDLANQGPLETGVPAAPAKPAEEAAPATPTGPERDAQGKFIPKPKEETPAAPADDPNKAAMREVIKREREARRKAEERTAELERRLMAPMAPAQPQVDPEAEILASMPPETQEWWKKAGSKLFDIRAQKVLAAEKATVAERAAAEEREQAADERDLDDWVADKMAEGEVVNERDMRAALDECEANGWRFGKSNHDHFEQVFKIRKKVSAGASAPVRTAKEAEASATAAAQAAARSGGVTPSSYAPPAIDRDAYNKALREASMRGDHNAVSKLLRERLRGTSVDRVFNPGQSPEG